MAARRPAKRKAPARRTRNPSTAPRPTDADIRRLVVREASTARGHEGLALMHYRLAGQMGARGFDGIEDHHRRMADAHRAMAVSLAHLAAAQRARRAR